MVEIEIDGKTVEAKEGAMIIEVTDHLGITVPRFCYHSKLSIAANCRMCLVEVEKSPKPLPACATPVAPGMKIRTQSSMAITAQRAVMEFLLINHPLDCPICDQGGQCELQDLAMGFGRGVSQYDEGKRAVANEDIGPLIATEMTRCIHCTRCVRFGEEVAGFRELGATHRGERMKIGTYVKHALQSEVSGNIIDLCPVGALLSKPFLFQGRAWEFTQHASISPHDNLGANIGIHTRQGELMRVVPRENEHINEVWLSDRDRFSYLGLKSPDRITQPMIRVNGVLRETDWETALNAAVDGLQTVIKKSGPAAIGSLITPSATVEELYLMQKVMRGLGSQNIDHRLQTLDFSDQTHAPVCPGLSLGINEIEHLDSILLIGCDLHQELPLLGLRVRKATRNGAKVMVVNPATYRFNFPLAQHTVVHPQDIAKILAGVAKALLSKGKSFSAEADALLKSVQPTSQEQQIAEHIYSGKRIGIFLGALGIEHSDASSIQGYASLIRSATDAQFGYLTRGANAAGAWLVGAVPHREVAGQVVSKPGLHAQAMMDGSIKAFILQGFDPEYDCANAAAMIRALKKAEFTIALTSYVHGILKEEADVILPITPFTENAGTYINLCGEWQTFKPAVLPYESNRPAWKVWRVLGHLFELEGFEYAHHEEVLADIKLQVHQKSMGAAIINADQKQFLPTAKHTATTEITVMVAWSIYGTDPIVRRAQPLQAVFSKDANTLRMNATQARTLQCAAGDRVKLTQGEVQLTLSVSIDEGVPDHCVLLMAGMMNSQGALIASGRVVILTR